MNSEGSYNSFTFNPQTPAFQVIELGIARNLTAKTTTRAVWRTVVNRSETRRHFKLLSWG